jgi:hypothetical protein
VLEPQPDHASSDKVPGAIWSLGKTLVDNAMRKSA